MECRKFQEHITAAVDNALDENEKRSLDAHLAQCPECRSEFEAEKLTRNIVKARCQRLRAPGYVLQRIVEQLETEQTRKTYWWSDLFASRYFRPAVAFAATCVVVVLLVSNNQTNAPRIVEASVLPPNDIVGLSLANYAAIERGEIKPQLISDKHERVQSFFDGKTDFPVIVPKVIGCTLVGGVANQFSGKTLAHVLYSHHDEAIVYIYETCWETVQKSSPFHLATDIQGELKRTGWYTISQPDGRTVVLWTNGNTLCAAVARLDAQTLLTCLNARQ